jgi:hypothetical protein
MVTSDNHSWFVFRRYNEFYKLYEMLKKQVNIIFLTVCYGLLKDRIIGSIFSSEATVMGNVSLDMLEQFVYP